MPPELLEVELPELELLEFDPELLEVELPELELLELLELEELLELDPLELELVELLEVELPELELEPVEPPLVPEEPPPHAASNSAPTSATHRLAWDKGDGDFFCCVWNGESVSTSLLRPIWSSCGS